MKFLYALIGTALISTSAMAAPRQLQSMKATAKFAINATRQKASLPIVNEDPQVLHETSSVTIIGFEKQGYAVIANDDLMPEVLAVSDHAFSNNENPGLQWWLRSINTVCETNVARGSMPRTTIKPSEYDYEPFVDPLVSALWDQDEPYNNMCPKKGGRTSITGCVATAIAQVFYTNKYPYIGQGTRTNTSASSITVNFDDEPYDYDNMLDSYAGYYTDEQAHAVAHLMLHCGVAVNMDYSPDGSGAYTDQAADGIRKYFGIEDAYYIDRDNYSEQDWMDMVYSYVSGGHPMYYSAVDRSPWTGGGHAFVLDGYNEAGLVHINWGWSGKDNGFFNIALLNPTGYQFDSYQDMILNMHNPNEATEGITLVSDTIALETPGTLNTIITDSLLITLSSVKLVGEINDDDISLLRQLATGDSLTSYGYESISHLKNIDLTEVTLQDNMLPNNAFLGATKLKSMVLPRNLEAIGKNAFNGCSGLSSIKSYSYNVPQTGAGCFTGVKGSSVNLKLIAGSSTLYSRNAQWKTIYNENNVIEFGTAFVVRNQNRQYGAANPVLGYVVYGERLVGSPKLTCDAKVNSPVGRYDVTIEPRGDMEINEDVVFVNGYLNVLKANLQVGVMDTVRYFGQPNPVFELTFDGFLNDDNAENAFTSLPSATVEADEESPVGTYTITVKGGESQNYNLKYSTGTLTILEAIEDGIDGVKEQQNQILEIRSLSGSVIRTNSLKNLPHGIYLINGKKVII